MEKQRQFIKDTIAIIESRPPNLQIEVGHFADFLRMRYLQTNSPEEWSAEETMRVSSEALWKIWDNDEDAIYDTL